MSTLVLAKKYPTIPIIGIDRSIHRLTKNNPEYLSPQKFNELQVQLNIDNKIKYNNDNDDNDNDDDYENDEELVDTSQYPNAILIQAELATFWMLAATRSDWIIDYHYLLYPNPYPKSKHLKRRWHGHPVFPALLALGGNVIVRSNWPIYCEEFISAIKAIDNSNALNGFKCKVNNVHQIPFPNENESMSHFERKYIRVKVPLFEASAKCGTTDLSQRLLLLKQEQQ
jgi:tRNA G46 methylase TrmB